jgi:hypothetical protein
VPAHQEDHAFRRGGRAEANLIYRRRQAELNVAMAKLHLPNVKTSDLNDTQSTTATVISIAQNPMSLAQLTLDNIKDKIAPNYENF